MFTFGNITAHGQVNLHPEKPPANLVWVDPKGHTNYWCSVAGDLSGSSSNPRTESRQTYPNSSESYNWLADGTEHSMSGVVRVELAPSSGKVIVGQIHAHKAPNPFVMVTWWNGFARIDVRSTPTGNAVKVLSVPCPLGKSFEYSLMVDSFGELHILLEGFGYHLPVDKAWEQYPFYFKSGAYCIDSEGPVEEGAWVVYEEFNVVNGEV